MNYPAASGRGICLKVLNTYAASGGVLDPLWNKSDPCGCPTEEGQVLPPSGGCEAVSLPDVRRTEGGIPMIRWHTRL